MRKAAMLISRIGNCACALCSSRHDLSHQPNSFWALNTAQHRPTSMFAPANTHHLFRALFFLQRSSSSSWYCSVMPISKRKPNPPLARKSASKETIKLRPQKAQNSQADSSLAGRAREPIVQPSNRLLQSMARRSKKSALQEINEGIEAHLSKLDPKERAERHKRAMDYVANLPSQPRSGRVRPTAGNSGVPSRIP